MNKLLLFGVMFGVIFLLLVVGVYAYHDSIPIFIKTSDNGYANGDFSITYTDFNLQEVRLYVNDEEIESFDYCDSGRDVECMIESDLSDFNNQKVNYFFELVDEDENVQYSNTFLAIVDTEAPEIIYENIKVIGRNVYFSFQVDEDNPLRIEYSDNGKNWKTLCSDSSVINCNKKRSFSKGYHDVLVRVSDRAGNYAEESFLVNV
ncbi:MAG: hypothetical protein AABW91_03265 [Nanoarchaeota archaeon]